ncbi:MULTISPECIES: class-II aminoacyl-tRNA synthetase family protein [Pectobacterium]|uniref:hypothetical protein n=1 Tax=Pectobacterium TaxID=122277 RepID=UPI000E260132|nr:MULTISPECIES: hypothetical protein [Pectobacterium]MCA6953416.1 hypothetical protein [Pectobacterium polaris]UEM39847.1 hypothetical protein DMB82_0002065 [Pectobacterium aquaticum]
MADIKEIFDLDDCLRSLWSGYSNIYQDNTIDKTRLEKLGYFKHFSHHLCGPGYLSPSAIATATKKGLFDDNVLEGGDVFFTPAACLNLYEPLFRISGGKEFTVLTSLAQVYRREAVYNPYRKLNFWVREFLFFGRRHNIDEAVNQLADRFMGRLLAKKGAINLMPATDSFVPNRFQNLMSGRQQLENAKLEFISSEANVSFGSVNYHGQHFIKSFNVEADGFETACIGIGLTRLNELVKQNILEITYDN